MDNEIERRRQLIRVLKDSCELLPVVKVIEKAIAAQDIGNNLRRKSCFESLKEVFPQMHLNLEVFF